jgi:hypothetical protein
VETAEEQWEEDEDEDEDEEETLELIDEDHRAIGLAKEIAKEILVGKHATPKVIAGIGFALYALDKFPNLDSGLRVELSIDYSYNRESSCVDFRVSDDAFEILPGGVANSGGGSDSYGEPGYRLQTTGHVERSCELWQIKDRVHELLNLGAKVYVTVEGGSFEEIDWEGEE